MIMVFLFTVMMLLLPLKVEYWLVWCCLMLFDAVWCCLMNVKTTLCALYYGIQWISMEWIGFQWISMEWNAHWNSMEWNAHALECASVYVGVCGGKCLAIIRNDFNWFKRMITTDDYNGFQWMITMEFNWTKALHENVKEQVCYNNMWVIISEHTAS